MHAYIKGWYLTIPIGNWHCDENIWSSLLYQHMMIHKGKKRLSFSDINLGKGCFNFFVCTCLLTQDSCFTTTEWAWFEKIFPGVICVWDELSNLAEPSMALSHFGLQGSSTISFCLALEELATSQNHFLEKTGLQSSNWEKQITRNR